MTSTQTGRYSKYIRPISFLLDLMVITILSLYFLRDLSLEFWLYLPYQTLVWVLIAYFIKFYQVYRFTTPVEIISKIFKQGFLFLLIIIAYFPFVKTTIFSGLAFSNFMVASFLIIFLFKFLLFYFL